MAHPDLDRLFNHCLGVAQSMLREHGELPPFAAIIRGGGALVPVMVDPSLNDIGTVAAAKMIADSVRRLAKGQQISAAALCHDSLFFEPGSPEQKRDAIAVGLEHINGESVDVYVPYRKRILLGYSFGKPISQERDRTMFAIDST